MPQTGTMQEAEVDYVGTRTLELLGRRGLTLFLGVFLR